MDLLSKAGYGVEAAGDGPSALRMAGRADVLLTDIGIPGMDGLELMSRARARHPRLAVIVMTGYDSPRRRSEAQRRGACAYLAKPFAGPELLGYLRVLEGVGRLRGARRRSASGDRQESREGAVSATAAASRANSGRIL
jgi:CheY-like chemotaxis protein